MDTKMPPKNNRSKVPTKGSQKMTRVRWSPEEQTLLINQAATLLNERQAFSLREAFNKSQDALPVGRQRQIAALTQIPWFTDAVPKRVKEIEFQKEHGLEHQIEAAIAKAKAEACDEFKHQLIRQGGQILAELIKVALEDATLRSVIQGGGVSIGRPDLSKIPVNRTKMKRVVVAGSLNSQGNVIAKEFGEKLDLRFWTKDQSNDTLRSMLQHADAAVAMVGFLSHPQDNIIKSSKVMYIPVSGGVTQVKLTLQKLLE
jgi:hypothetical protein